MTTLHTGSQLGSWFYVPGPPHGAVIWSRGIVNGCQPSSAFHIQAHWTWAGSQEVQGATHRCVTLAGRRSR